MTTTRPYLSRPAFSKPDHCTTGPSRIDLLTDPMLAPLFGAQRGGYATEGDALVTQTVDGVPLNNIWAEQAAMLAAFNAHRTKVARLLSYPTTSIADPILQTLQSESFERSSEFGEPGGIRPGADPLLVGYGFEHYDKASRFTWKALLTMTAEQVTSVINLVAEADDKLVNTAILERLFNPAERRTPEGNREFGLWNGTDGLRPLPYLGKTFPQNTNHYIASGAPVIDSGDLEDAIKRLQNHGYAADETTRILILANPDEAEAIQGFRRGEESRAPLGSETAGAPRARFSFIQSESAPAYLTDENVVGQIAPGEYGGLPVLGSYGPAWLIQSHLVPAGYVAVIATGGPNSEKNVVGFRQHPQTALQGLRAIPGRDQRYPLIDTYYARAFGVGVRHRSGAAVIKVTTGSTYTAPVFADFVS